MSATTITLLSLAEVEQQADRAATIARNEQRLEQEQQAGKELRQLYDNLRLNLSLDLDAVPYEYQQTATVPRKRLDKGSRIAPVVTIGDYRFTTDQENARGLYLLGQCPNCHLEVLSESIFNLTNFGLLRKEFKPHYAHTLECTPEAPAGGIYQVTRDEFDFLTLLHNLFGGATQ